MKIGNLSSQRLWTSKKKKVMCTLIIFEHWKKEFILKIQEPLNNSIQT